jgi:hypothetical protein
MNSKDSSNLPENDVHRYWLQTVLEDRAECAGAPVLPLPADDEEDL